MSTYSPNLRIELPTNGTQAGVWGDTTNNNLTYILESAVTGYQLVSVTSVTGAQALTYSNGPTSTAANDQAVYAILQFTTTTGAAFSVYAPPVSKTFIVWNNSGQSMTIYNSTVIGDTTAAGAGIVVSNGNKVLVWSDGTNFYEVQASNLTGTLAIANGGTGQTTANAALNALLPAQTNNRVLRSNGTNTSFAQVALTTDVTGTLPVANGGTGQASNLTQYGVIYGSTTTAMATTLAGTSTQVLHGNSSGAPTWGAVSLTADVSGTLPVANGGTGQASNLTQYGVLYGSTTTAMATTSAGTSTQVLHGNASGAPTWGSVSLSSPGDVSGTLSIANGGTGQTTQQAALNSLAGAVTSGYYLRGNGTNVSMSVLSAGDLSGTLAATNGGTGQSTVTTGDLLYGSATNTWAKLADVATGNALISGGVGIAPLYGKIGLTTHVSGTLPVANGGTGNTSQSQYAVLYAATTSSLTGDPNALSFDGTNLGIGTNSPSTYGKLTVLGTGSFTNSLVSTSATAADKPTFEFRKTRNTGLTENNAIGRLSFYSQNSTTTTESAYIDVTDVRISNIPLPQISLVCYNQTIGSNSASLNLGGTQTRLFSGSSSGIDYVASGGTHTFTGDVVFEDTVDLQGGISTAGTVTVANLATAAKPIGASQTWQDFTGIRAGNTTYTNSTGRPIMVNITGGFTVNQTAQILVDSIVVAYAGWNSFASGQVIGSLSAIVPAGSTYILTTTGFNNPTWAELR